MSPTPEPKAELPRAHVKRHWGLLWIWAVPLAALGLVAYLSYTYWVDRGPLITITFQTAEGISPQKTEVRYKAVTLGTVQEAQLSDDASHVVVHVRMRQQAEPMLNAGTKFWVVRPRLGGGLSGLGEGLKTLVSGSYLAIDPGDEPGFKDRFEGLEEPPNVRSGQPGSVFFLQADALGGVDKGAPVHFHDVQVGEVLSYNMDLEASSVRFRVFVEAPYDQHVSRRSRFWRASGIGITTAAEGLSIKLQSAQTLFMGGIAFDTPAGATQPQRAAPKSTFELFEDRESAVLSFYDSVPLVTYFQGSASGLTEGANVSVYGRTVGAVTDVSLGRDPRQGHTGEIAVRVAFVVQPERIPSERARTLFEQDGIRQLVDRGMRVVLASSSMVTGHKALSLEHIAPPEPATLAMEAEALVLPGEVQGLQQVTGAMSALANDVRRIPFAAIGDNLNRILGSVGDAVDGSELEQSIVALHATLQEARGLVEEARLGLRPALQRLPTIASSLERAATKAEASVGREGYGANSTLHRNVTRMTDRIAEAARSIELLADFLNRHPEALISGRSEQEDE